MNINHLIYFDEVYKQGKIITASEILHISQPSITCAIHKLEDDLGYKLFYRANNQLKPTLKGATFHELTVDFLNKYKDYQAKAYDLAISKVSTIKLGIPTVMGTFILQKIVPAFNNKYPNIQLKIFEIPTLDGIKALNNANVDFLFGLESTTSNSICDSIVVISTELQLAVSSTHPFAKEPIITMDMLSKIPIVAIAKGSFHYDLVAKLADDLPITDITYSSQLATIEYLIKNNKSATIIYKNVFKDKGDIVYIPLESPIHAQIRLFWQKNTYRSAQMKLFISFVQSLNFD